MTPTKKRPGLITIDLSKIKGLILPIYSEPYEVKCEHCDGIRESAPSCNPYERSLDNECSVCHGKGTRTVRLVGWVPFSFSSGAEYGTHDVYEYIPDTEIAGWGPDLTPEITAAYRAGTLPASIREGLVEIPVESDEK